MNNKVKEYLEKGGIVAIPTDTVYGFFGLPNKKVIKEINTLKQSPENKKLSLMASSLSKYDGYINIDSGQQRFIESKLPGKYTFIVKVNESSFINDLPWSDSIGIRVPDDKTSNSKRLLEILDMFDFLVSTSVNISGEPPMADYKEIRKSFPTVMVIENIEPIFDNKPTKIYSLLEEDVKIIRE